MSVLITGATGFIGAELCSHLLKMGHEVVAVGRSEEKLRQLKTHAPLGRGQLITLQSDLASLHKLPNGVTVVIHAAAVREPEARESPSLAIETNVGSTVRLMRLASTAGVKRFVLLSTQAVYGRAISPWREDQQPEPEGIYALSKYAAEQAVLNMLVEVEPVILRVSRVYGTGLFMRWNELVGWFVHLARTGQVIEVHGDGQQRVDLVHIKDLIDAIAMFLNHGFPLPSSVYNIGGGKSFTVQEIATIVQEVAVSVGLKCPSVTLRPDITPTGPRHLELDISRIRNHLGWEPRVPVHQGVQEYFLKSLGWYLFRVEIVPQDSTFPRRKSG